MHTCSQVAKAPSPYRLLIRLELRRSSWYNHESRNSNVTLAQAYAQKAAALPDNIIISEIMERNNRIADSLVTGLRNLEANVTSLASDSQEQIYLRRVQYKR